ncbi:Uu.00g038230.m01.CDS01 [Anthostomella pinea]|uniref:PinX1-related protein 1 n=1 Tax=Anthostomella pinea TaxID=933095 RepID=A0AAI8YDQ0_9PEZI|nr:Uu.00g038230.m01.CDS01 [Anthostomella pinea]
MGLAGTKVRRKLEFDPNNTKWSRDETTFGQKILRAQGWEPGKFLGAQDSSHSHLHSAASSAPIKINLKDDNLGLGAKPRQKQSDECTGLNGFADLLGRLNGKSDAVIQKEQQVRSEIKTSLFVERRYGAMRFVSGGLLVGDQMKPKETASKSADSKSLEKAIKEESSSADVGAEPAKKQKKEKKSKKRKAEEAGDAGVSDVSVEKKRQKRSRDEDSPNADSGAESPKKKKRSKDLKAVEDETEPSKPKKKSKKSKDVAAQVAQSNIPNEDDAKAEKSRRKKERREKKEKKRQQAAASDSSTEATTSTHTIATALEESGSSTPVAIGTSTPQPLSNRHFARSRNIASKRMAYTDLAALNQIFMVKPV